MAIESDTEIDPQIDVILKQLEDLTLQHEETQRQLQVAQQTLERISDVVTQIQNQTGAPAPAPSVPSTSTLSRSHSPLKIGDNVRVLNPSRGQPHTATIFGFQKSGFFRIKLSNDIRTRRLPRNLSKIE